MAVTKVINSESKQYKPVLVDSLVLDAAPTVGSLNGVTSDGVAKAISGSGSVPTPTADDDGTVLTANDGSDGLNRLAVIHILLVLALPFPKKMRLQ